MYQNVRFYMILWSFFTNINHKLPMEPTKISPICALDALELGEPGGDATGEPGGEPGLGAQPRKCRWREGFHPKIWEFQWFSLDLMGLSRNWLPNFLPKRSPKYLKVRSLWLSRNFVRRWAIGI
jgi:hypothetical protein